MDEVFFGTKWGDKLLSQSTVEFTHNSAIMIGPYWEQFGGSGTYNASSTIEKITINIPTKIELVRYADGRLIVQAHTPHFFSRMP